MRTLFRNPYSCDEQKAVRVRTAFLQRPPLSGRDRTRSLLHDDGRGGRALAATACDGGLSEFYAIDLLHFIPLMIMSDSISLNEDDAHQ
jgi:hypothetical protein